MKKLRLLVCTMLLCMCSVLPTQASEEPMIWTEEVFQIELPQENQDGVMGIWSNFMEISLNYSVNSSKTLYYNMSISPYDHTSYFTGILRLYDGSGNVLALHSVRDTDSPYVSEEFTRSVSSGEKYQIGFSGYVYMTPGGNGEYVDVKTSIFTIP